MIDSSEIEMHACMHRVCLIEECPKHTTYYTKPWHFHSLSMTSERVIKKNWIAICNYNGLDCKDILTLHRLYLHRCFAAFEKKSQIHQGPTIL